MGGGHNGLVAGVYLARGGVEVTVLEAAETPGGCVWTQTLPDGSVVERGAVDHGGVRAVADDLGLAEFGLRYVERDRLATTVFGDGTTRAFEVSAERTAAALGADERAYLALTRRAGAFFGVLDSFPTAPTPTALAAALRDLPGGDDTFRMLLSPAEAVLERSLTDPHTRAALALYAAHGQIPPWAPGSGMLALLLPAAHGAPAVRPEGGSGALVTALTAALEAAGGTLRTGAHVTRISRTASGYTVTLDGGERLTSDRVLSTLDVRRTTALLADPPPALARAAAHVSSGRLNVCELTVSVTGVPVPEPCRGATGPVCFVQDGLDDLRRGFGDVLAGRLPASPWAMVAGAGTGVWLSSVVPLRRADGPWTPALEEEAADRVLRGAGRILGADLATGRVTVTGPASWAARLHGDGNPNHLDLTIDQLLGWRPPGLPVPRTPLPGLYLAGAGTHPGGGLSGVSARTAANALLTDTRTPRSPSLRSRLLTELSSLPSALRAYRALRTP